MEAPELIDRPWHPDCVQPHWRFFVCQKCGFVVILEMACRPSNLVSKADPRPRWSTICLPCRVYEIEFDLRYAKWKAAYLAMYNEEHFDMRAEEFAWTISNVIWYGDMVEEARSEYALLVRRLVELKQEEIRISLGEATPIVIPPQVPWSWLRNTDYGRFRVDSAAEAV